MTPIVPYLRRQFEKGRPILFTGAGFSLGCKNELGDTVASVGKLNAELWNLCFPGTPVDPDSTLQSLYESAQLQHRNKIQPLLTPLLTVEPNSIPVWYRDIFSLPWHKIYTLNLDNLASAVNRAFDLPRSLNEVSSMRGYNQYVQNTKLLDVIHLNGTLEDLPDKITFSDSQYAERLAREDPFYLQLAAELLNHPFVFVGTKLNEPPLWQHVQLRFARGPRIKEYRPHSYLLVPTLDKAREVSLSQFNIDWLSLTADRFAAEVIPQLVSSSVVGLSYITSNQIAGVAADLKLVTELATNPTQKTEFLFGSEPIWADIQAGRAIERECDRELNEKAAIETSSASAKNIILVSGTAGSGKSASLMRCALELSNKGLRVGWIDRSYSVSPRSLRSRIVNAMTIDALCVDDADSYGNELSSMLAEFSAADSHPLVIIAIRSGKIDRVLNPAQLRRVKIQEVVMPPLTDSDIQGLIESLDKENRLGNLKGLSFLEQVAAFKQQAGRQLLVAMIQATSGYKFEDKAVDEYTGLTFEARAIYGLLCAATHLGFNLSKNEIIVALNEGSNATLGVLDELTRRNIVVQTGNEGFGYRARHRVIADLVFDKLRSDELLFDVLTGLARAAATQIRPGMPRSTRPMRLLIKILSHDFCHRCFGVTKARTFYNNLEQLLSNEPHFWLQRANLELEDGLLQLAENWIGQARGLAPDDALIQTTFAHFLFRKAIENPNNADADSYVQTAMGLLKASTAKRGNVDTYPYHILGSQGLAWSRHGIPVFEKRRDYLETLRAIMADAVSKHPRNDMVLKLSKDINDEYLNLPFRA
jgi:hypothetical protein